MLSYQRSELCSSASSSFTVYSATYCMHFHFHTSLCKEKYKAPRTCIYGNALFYSIYRVDIVPNSWAVRLHAMNELCAGRVFMLYILNMIRVLGWVEEGGVEPNLF